MMEDSFEEIWDEANEDWYNDSDTSEEIPDPNIDPQPLYQEVDKLPTILQRDHFVEGIIYTMTLGVKKEQSMLILVLQTYADKFTYRNFFVLNSKRKTWHQGGKG